MNGTPHPDTATVAIRLAVTISRLRSRLREEAGATSTGLSISQLAVLQRILGAGSTTAASLAAAEHVSQQAIAQCLATLKAAGLVEARPDPRDARKSLVSVTAAGRRLIDTMLASRDAWLVRAIDAHVAPAERADLDRAIELLERLAGADLAPRRGVRVGLG